MQSKSENLDERFHFEIWSGPSRTLIDRNPSVSYCENHNGDFDYDLAATDFVIAAQALIEIHRQQPHMSNWTAPVLHLVRHTLELKLKALLQTIGWKTGDQELGINFSHNIRKLWSSGLGWLVENDYQIERDARLKSTNRLIENMYAIDPSGDLFRFGTSREVAFGRQKSSDRVGFSHEDFFSEFEDACGCLSHWTGIVMREIISTEQQSHNDPELDKISFPKLK